MNSPAPSPAISRRVMLKTVTAVGLAASVPRLALAQLQTAPPWQAQVAAFLERLARADGGYAWAEQAQSHLTPTFAAIGCYRLLKQPPPNRRALAEFVRQHHPSRLKRLEQPHHEFEYQQIQSLVWLGEEVDSFRAQVAAWKQPEVYFKQYEQHSYPIFRHQSVVFRCRALLGLPLAELAPEYLEYLDARRRANGSFNNTPARDGGDGHVLNTWWGLEALRLLGRQEKPAETVNWLQACQLASGGFTYQPQPEFGGVDDVAYTWAAVRSLRQLGAAPANPQACLAYLRSLANEDGGFGDRPGWSSNAVATYYALEALGALDSDVTVRKAKPRRKAALPADLKVFSIQLEAHGHGSPADAVELARALRIHLWGAKNAQSAWIARAQAWADQQQVPVKFFVANEEYGTWVNVPGLGTYSHTSDILAPAGRDCGTSLANRGVVSWPEFRERRLAPLQRAGGRLIWQFGENEALARLYLDDSLQRGGYAAISTFHFGNPDFTNSEPFLQRYLGQIPFIALQDAHGEEPWWFADMTTGFRTVFLAAEPTWEAWLQALERNWVAAIRHDAASGFQTWMHSGSPEVAELVRQRQREWQWWDNPEIYRPLVSLVALTPHQAFETAAPDAGIRLRIRCAWNCTFDALPESPIAELVQLTVDGKEVSPELVAPSRGKAYADHYYQYDLPAPTPGRHSATAVVRVVETKAESSRTIHFMV